MKAVYAVLALVIGMSVALQGVVNSRLRAEWDLSSAILLNAVIVMLLSGTVWLVAGMPIPSREAIAQTPPATLFGGVMGAVIIYFGAIVFGRLPASVALGLILLGQFGTGLVVDATGWLGMPRVAVTPTRLAGLAFIGLGVFLMRK
ncbi:MAG: DMT family transporter [Myxococcota bacterium]